ncbi:hypothetical protein, partial [Serratia marcescens]|uniref:hypothetical protein n=1 Tax=Serratia marcescens TaxID=615 RepID=UPI002813CD30
MLKYMKERIIIEQTGRPKITLNDVQILSRLNDMHDEIALRLSRLSDLGSWCPDHNLKFEQSEFSYLFWPSHTIPQEKVNSQDDDVAAGPQSEENPQRS